MQTYTAAHDGPEGPAMKIVRVAGELDPDEVRALLRGQGIEAREVREAPGGVLLAELVGGGAYQVLYVAGRTAHRRRG